jgi:nucleolar protein 53
VVHAGASVNPDKVQHQEAMRVIHDKVVQQQKEWEILSLKVRGLYDDGKKEELPAYDPDAPIETRSVSSLIVEVNPKSKAERNRLARKKVKEQELKEQQKIKAMNREMHDLKNIRKEIVEEEVASKAEKQRIAGLKEEDPEYHPKRLGKFVFKEELPEVLLTEEIAEEGNLRKTRPSLRVVKDQFKRFQEKRLIEPREKNRYRRRYGLKTYNRHKDMIV